MLRSLFGLFDRHQRPNRYGPFRVVKPRRVVPSLETLESRVALSPVLCDDQFSFEVGTNTYKIPYCHNYALDVPNREVTRVIVAVHGLERTAVSTYNDVLSAAQDGAGGADRTALIIAPQFLNESDISAYDLPDDYMYWNGPWRDGAQSSSTSEHPRPDKVSSYEVVDDLLTRIADSGNFPHLDTVIVSGHSAGGQFMQHYAATSQVEKDLSENHGLSMRYITMNPGSYLYLDPKRWNPSEGAFDIPPRPPDYNDYPYGLDNVSTTQYPYIAKLDPDTIRTQYGERQVIYILGEDDIGTDHNLDTSPPAMLQGKNRFERGTIFFEYLQDYYGPGILDHQVRETVPGVGHDSTAMYASAPALKWLFDFDGSVQPGNTGVEPRYAGTGTYGAFVLANAGGGGLNSPIVSKPAETRRITSDNVGALDGISAFANIQDLTGGAVNDLLGSADRSPVPGIVNGNSSGDSLDLSGLTNGPIVS
jgi:hypothetical protein